MKTNFTEYFNKETLIDALNHLDELADIGADEVDKPDLEKSYNFLYQFISNLK